MESKDQSIRRSAGVICVALGLFAWTDFLYEISSGDLDFTNYEPLLLPMGIGLMQPGRLWMWLGRFQLFTLAVYSAILIFGSATMTAQTEFLVFEFDRSSANARGVGIIVLMHTFYLAGIVWVYFSIFTKRRESNPIYELNSN